MFHVSPGAAGLRWCCTFAVDGGVGAAGAHGVGEADVDAGGAASSAAADAIVAASAAGAVACAARDAAGAGNITVDHIANSVTL